MSTYWLATTEFPPFSGGGIATYSNSVTKQLADFLDSIEIFYLDRSARKTAIEENSNIKVHRICIKEFSDLDLVNTPLAAASAFCNYLMSKHFTSSTYEAPLALEVTDWGCLPYFVLKNKRQGTDGFQFPIIVSSHGPLTLLAQYDLQPISPQHYLLKSIESEIYSLADLILVPTLYAKHQLSEYYFMTGEEKIQTINYPIDKEIIPDYNKKEKAKEKNIVFLGRKQYIKGYDFFVAACNGILLEDHKYSSIGGDSWFYQLNCFGSQIKSRKRIIDYGLLTHDETLKVLNQKDIAVLPSRVEWFSYAAIECALHGLQLVIPENTGTFEVMNKLNYKKVSSYSPNNASKLLEALEDAISKQNFVETTENIQIQDWNESYSNDIKQILIELNDKTFSRKNHNLNQISVFIPHFNLSKYLKSSILSCIDSGIPLSNIKVIDDGSSEIELRNAIEICSELNVEIIFQQNKGLSATRNILLSLCETKYILFLDADDEIRPNYPRAALQVWEQNQEIVAIGTNLNLIDAEGKKYATWRSFSPSLPLVAYMNCINSAGLIWNAERLKYLGGFDEDFKYGFEDWDLVYRSTKLGNVIYNLVSYDFNYRVRRKGMFKSMSFEKKLLSYQKIISKEDDRSILQALNTLYAKYGSGFALSNPWTQTNGTFFKYLNTLRVKNKIVGLIWELMTPGFKGFIFKIVRKI